MRVHTSLGVLLALMASLAVGNSSAEPRIPSPEGTLDDGYSTDITIQLQPAKHKDFDRKLYSISDPHHEDYGMHLTREEAQMYMLPKPEAFETVQKWLLAEGVSQGNIQDEGSRLRVRASFGIAESIMGRKEELGKRSMMSLGVPSDVRQYISTIRRHDNGKMGHRGTDSIPIARRADKAMSFPDVWDRDLAGDVDLEECKEKVVPACIRELYRMDKEPAKPHSKTLYGVPGFRNQTAQYDEFEEFISRFDSFAAGANFSVALENGGENQQGEYPSGEGNLDIQYAVSLAFNTPVQYIAFGGEYRDFIPDLDIPDPDEEFVEPFLEFAEYLMDLPNEKLPQVVSISYGINEQVLPESYARDVCDKFGVLGMRGVSVISAAGNNGPGASCQTNDGKNSTRFLPQFPGSCPYVTSVGATESNSPEIAKNFSSGGFSEYFGRPDWQDDVVKEYLKAHGGEWEGYYNPDGRAYPDVAALGWGYQIVNHDEVETTGGTSAASPVFAAMISLINNQRFHDGKPAMGFLNPWIWSIGDIAFTDITEGKSVGCEGESFTGLPSPVIPDAGWRAVKGWDPVTGFGTPLFDKLKELAFKKDMSSEGPTDSSDCSE